MKGFSLCQLYVSCDPERSFTAATARSSNVIAGKKKEKVKYSNYSERDKDLWLNMFKTCSERQKECLPSMGALRHQPYGANKRAPPGTAEDGAPPPAPGGPTSDASLIITHLNTHFYVNKLFQQIPPVSYR